MNTTHAYVGRILLGLSLVVGVCSGRGTAEEAMPVLSVPVDPAEYQAACRHDPFLQRLSMQNAFGYSGMGTLLLADDALPILERPHVPWARPLKEGPLRIAYFVNHNGHGMGDMAEVARRLDCRLYTVELVNYPMWEFYPADHPLGWQARKTLKTLERDLDVIVLVGGAQYLTTDVQAAVLAKVRAGTGLYIGDIRRFSPHSKSTKSFAEDAPFLELMPFAGPQTSHADAQLGAPVEFLQPEMIDAVPFATVFPRTRYSITPIKDGWTPVATHGGQPVWYAGRVGKGRVIASNYGNIFPATERDPLPFSRRYQEYAAAGIAKLLRWAAGRTPAARLAFDVPGGAPAGQAFAFAVEVIPGGVAIDSLELACTIRDLEFRSLSSSTRQMAIQDETAQRAVFEMPAVPAGASFVIEVIARDSEGRAVDWGQTMVTTEAPETMTVRTDREIAATGDRVAIEARLDNAIEGAAYSGELLVWDETGRELMRRTLPFADGRLDAVFEVSHAVTAPHHAQVTLSRDGRAVRVAEAVFYVPSFGWSEWVTGLWPAWWTQQYQYEQQHRSLMRWTGTDASSAAHGREPYLLSRLGLKILRLNDATVNPAAVYDDPVAEQARSVGVRDQAIHWAQRYGAVAWNLQDERHLGRELPFSESNKTRFRAYLREVYGHDLDALNRAWGTELASFDTAEPMMLEDVPGEPTDLGGWVDTRLFIRHLVSTIDRTNAEAVRAAVPGEQAIGIDAFTDMSHHAYSGTDWGQMLTGYFNTHFPYTGERMTAFTMLRNLLPRSAPFPTRGGEKMDPRREYYARPWREALAGGTGGVLGLTRWIGSTFVHEYGYLYESARWFEAAERPLREGLGTLLGDSERQVDGVAFLYSYPSMMTSLALGRLMDPANKHLMHRPGQWSVQSLQALVWDNGFTADWLTDEQVAGGALEDGCRLLVIGDFMGVALSDAACAAIRAFVEKGGTVLADLCPALYDEHGGLREAGGLDDVFGVHRANVSFGRRPADYLVNGMKYRDPRFAIQDWFIGEYFETSLEVDGGTALGEHIFLDEPVPALVLNDFGQGHALLLNFLETQYIRHPYPGPLALVRDALRLAGLDRPAVDVTDADGLRRWGYQTTRYRDGQNLYVGIYRLGDTPSFYADRTFVHLPREGHVYLAGGILDAANGMLQERAYLGRSSSPEVTLDGMGSVLLAVLPYRVESLAVDMPLAAERGVPVRGRVALKTSTAPGRHVVHVRVTDPDGARHPHYSRNVRLAQGSGDVSIPFALNDTPGLWTVTARDAVSGCSATIQIDLK